MDRLIALWHLLGQTARLMVGVADYDTYVAHRRKHHPGEPIMDRAAFFRACQDRRYARGSAGRCC